MPNLTELLILALATWRISSYLSGENGPWDIFERIRVVIGVRYDEQNFPYGKNELARTILCIWCISPLIGLAFGVFWWYTRDDAILFALPFALSAATIIIDGRGIRYRKRRT